MRDRNSKTSIKEIIASRSDVRPQRVKPKIRKAQQEDLLAFSQLLYDMYEEGKKIRKNESQNG